VLRSTKPQRQIALCASAIRGEDCGVSTEWKTINAATEKESMKRAYLTLFVIALISVPVLAQTPQKLAEINKKVVGKWGTSDGKSYIEFLANGSCSVGELWPDGKWKVDQGTLGAWQQGDEFSCGSGALTLIGPNTLTRDY
jgi:hypothetical protein